MDRTPPPPPPPLNPRPSKQKATTLTTINSQPTYQPTKTHPKQTNMHASKQASKQASKHPTNRNLDMTRNSVTSTLNGEEQEFKEFFPSIADRSSDIQSVPLLIHMYFQTEIEAEDQSRPISTYSDTGPTSPNTNSLTSDA